ncbi:MAG: RidA family protein [Geminicoccaceae bacterium]
MPKAHNPTTVAPPFSRYSHAIEAPASARWLHISGQVGVTPDGRTLDGAEAQMEQAWRNIFALLDAAGMTRRDLVKVTIYLTDRAHLQLSRSVRDRMLQGKAEPASTLVIVSGLASADWGVEIEALAAAE